MKKFLIYLGLLGLLVYPVTAVADTINTETVVEWQKSCQTGDNHATRSLRPGQFACFEPLAKSGGLDSDATDNSPMLSTTNCENIDMLFWDDMLGTPADGNELTVYSCATPTDASGDAPNESNWSSTGICWIITGTPMDGVSGNTEAVYGGAAEWIYADPTGTWTGDMGRVIVRCNP
jgi:hypothetical protein